MVLQTQSHAGSRFIIRQPQICVSSQSIFLTLQEPHPDNSQHQGSLHRSLIIVLGFTSNSDPRSRLDLDRCARLLSSANYYIDLSCLLF